MIHPNKRDFTGILAFIDELSDGPPEGARGHRIILSKRCVDKCLGTILGMGLNFSNDMSYHKTDSKCGVITTTWVEENRIHIGGFLYESDFPGLIQSLATEEHGLSFEMKLASYSFRHQFWFKPDWVIEEGFFSGAAILRKDRAAYKRSSIKLVERKILEDSVCSKF